MREKLQSLPMAELREIAKANGIKSVTTMRKEALIDRIIECGTKAEERKETQREVHQEVPKEAPKPAVVSEPAPSYARTEQRNPAKLYIPPVCPDVKLDGSLTPEEETRQLQADYYDPALDSGTHTHGILEIMQDGFGFIRCENYMPGENDVYVAPVQIRRFNLKTGDIIDGRIKVKMATEKFAALLYIEKVNGLSLGKAKMRKAFEDLTPIFPNERLLLETGRHNMAMRIVDLVSPVGKGQRGMIVAQPKAGKTTLLKEIAKSVTQNNPEMHMIILLIDERPEEVTDIKEAIEGDNVEVIYSTFDELPEHHKRVSEMVIERAKRLVEHGQDVIILLDSITRLARAYNLVEIGRAHV